MADLFLELLSEEIPARLQIRAQEDLKRLVTEELGKVKLNFEIAQCYSTPRRLILFINGLPEKTETEIEEKRGPNVLAPKAAIDGFCKSMNIDNSQLYEKEEKKGRFFYARLENFGRTNSELIPEILCRVINNFPWPKSMRWGSGNFRWVRPLRSIVCLLSDDTRTSVLPLEFNGVKSGNTSVGHRFMSPEKFTVFNFEDYQEQMSKRYVLMDRKTRREKIWDEAGNIAFAVGLELVEDKNLLEELVGLVEWPVVLMGNIDQEFLCLPPEVLQVSMREHQKFLSLRCKDESIIKSFLVISNIASEDFGERVIRGNERVLRARLSDAKFFWDNDLREIESNGFSSFYKKLEKVTFHNKLGNEAERVERITEIALVIANLINADLENTKTAASICKLDLVSEMVFEFPELQGVLGYYYAREAGFNESIARVCRDHYLPRGPDDNVPQSLVSVAVALADKIDMVCSFWSINVRPTGSKDPFALRRAVIGIIRIILDNELTISLFDLLKLSNLEFDFGDLMDFFNERIRGQFIEKGIQVDVLNSINLKSDQNLSLKQLYQRAMSVQNFVSTDAGRNLIQGYKRAINILNAEEIRDGVGYSLAPKAKYLKEEAEIELHKKLIEVEEKIRIYLQEEKIECVLSNMSTLRRPIDGFFDRVQINSDESIVRRNRLCLINQIREIMHQVADFSKIDG